MGKVILNDTTLTGIADAIRSKNGETNTYLPSEMAQKIIDIPSGGGGDFVINNNFIYYKSRDTKPLEDAAQRGDYILADYMFYDETNYPFASIKDIPLKILSATGAFTRVNGNPNNFPEVEWDFSKCINMSSCFRSTFIPSINLTGFNTRNVVSFSGCFYSSSITSLIGIDDLKTDSAADFSAMFYGTRASQELNLNWNVEKVIEVSNMFYDSRFKTINLGKLNFKKLQNVPSFGMSRNYTKSIVLPNLPAVSASGNMNILDSNNSSNYDIHCVFGEGNTWGQDVNGISMSLSLVYLWRTANFVDNYVEFANSIAENTSGFSRNVRVYTTLYDALTDEQIELLTDKGYTVVRASS